MARYYYRQSLLNRYKDYMVYTALGLIDFNENKLDDAKRNLLKALSLEPRTMNALNGLGGVFFKQNEYEKAKKCFAEASKVDRLAIFPRLNLAKTWMKEGNAPEAIKIYQDILSILPHHDLTLIYLIQIYLANKDRENSLKIAKELYEFSVDPLILTNVGIVFSSYHLYHEAIDSYKKAIYVAPKAKQAYWLLGELYNKNQQYDLAKEYWEKGLALDPTDNRFKQNLSQLGQ